MNGMVRVGFRIALFGLALGGRTAMAAGMDDIAVSGAWARATVPGQPVAAAYFDIASGQGATLTGVRSDASGAVQVHSMTVDGGVMRVREMEQLALPAGQTVRLAPSGTHLMLLDLRRPLRVGENVTLDLTLLDGSGQSTTVRVLAPVRKGPTP